MSSRADLVVVGAGIIGLAHAFVAARTGARVVVLERDRIAQGASIRNFGMVFPLGQPKETRALAMASRELWLEAGRLANIRVDPVGTLMLARREDEEAVLREFLAAADPAHRFEWLTPDAACERSRWLQRDGLVGALLSPHELVVEPRDGLPGLTRMLAGQFGVRFEFETAVTTIRDRIVHTADGRRIEGDRILVASGHDLRTLFPTQLAASGIEPCKLHMARTAAQPSAPPRSPHLCSGLTLRHYDSFASCPSIDALRTRIATEQPTLDEFGIHVMASQTESGELILGDSHQYGDEATPFDDPRIDDWILSELRQLLDLPTWRLAARWTGTYAKHPTRPYVELDPAPGVKLLTGFGGAGMTLSFGVAQEVWRRWTDATS